MRIIADTYVLDEESLRRGTTADVYSAVNAARQQFAVKLYRSDGPAVGYAQELFSRERAALTALDHPGIVRLVDAGYSVEEASHYVVMEWVDTPLRAWLQTSAIEGWDSLMEEIGVPILRALRYAHERSVSHRDVKTDNVMMREGEPVLVDFGLARLLDAASLGATVRAFGTKPYAPPEHPEADHRGDLYSLGVTLVECFDLKAFDWDPSSYAESAARAIARMDIRPQARTFLERLLAVDPDDRYPTAELTRRRVPRGSRRAQNPEPGFTFRLAATFST
jgi:serine/threonine protein kinase